MTAAKKKTKKLRSTKKDTLHGVDLSQIPIENKGFLEISAGLNALSYCEIDGGKKILLVCTEIPPSVVKRLGLPKKGVVLLESS